MKVPEVLLDGPCSFLTWQFPWTPAQWRRDDLCCLVWTARKRKPKSFVQSLCVLLFYKPQLNRPAYGCPGCKGDQVNLRCFRANSLCFVRGTTQQHRPFPGRANSVLLGRKQNMVANFFLHKKLRYASRYEVVLCIRVYWAHGKE